MIEVVAVLFVFGIVTTGIFVIFAYSSAGFQHAISQGGLTGEIEAIQRKLTADFKATHYGTSAVVPRTMALKDGANVSRDALSFTTLSDWQDPSKFYPTGLPRWDRYVVYYATLDDSGEMIRQIVDPGVLYAPVPYANLGDNISNTPTANENLLRSSSLSKNVLSYKVDTNDARQLLEVTLKLRDTGGRVEGSNRQLDETREAVFSLDALNTYPRL